MSNSFKNIQKSINRFIKFGDSYDYNYAKMNSKYDWWLVQTHNSLLFNDNDQFNDIGGFMIYSDSDYIVLTNIVNNSENNSVIDTEILTVVIPKAQIISAVQSYNPLLDNDKFKDKISIDSDGFGFDIRTGQSLQKPIDHLEEDE